MPAPAELGIPRRDGSILLPPSETGRVKPNETLLLPQPGFLARFAAEKVVKNHFPQFAKTAEKPDLSEEELAFLEEALVPFQEEVVQVGETLFAEYDHVLVYANHLAGFEKVTLVRHWKSIQRQRKTGETVFEVQQGGEIATNPTVSIGSPAIQPTFLRDLFTEIGDLVFVNPVLAPIFTETSRFLISPLGEGGKILPAGKSVLIAEDLEDNSLARKHVALLKEKGFATGYLPLVDQYKQPLEKRNFTPGHIDGHNAHFEGIDQRPRLFFAASYFDQSATTGRRVKLAAAAAEVSFERVDDSHLEHLAFNALQFRDRTVLLNGRRPEKRLTPNAFEMAVVRFLGNRRVHRLPICVKEIAEVGGGSLRCLTNIAPNDFLKHIQNQ